jgi:hypothetical protein
MEYQQRDDGYLQVGAGKDRRPSLRVQNFRLDLLAPEQAAQAVRHDEVQRVRPEVDFLESQEFVR